VIANFSVQNQRAKLNSAIVTCRQSQPPTEASIMRSLTHFRALRLLAVPFLALLSACSSNPKVTTDYDPNHNFGVIKSYHIVEKDRPMSDLIEERLINGIQQAMTARGITAASAEQADVLIDFMVTTKDKTRVTSYNTSYAYHRPYGFGYGYGYPANDIDVRQYTEGTLLVDLVDTQAKKTVWRGTASTIVKNRTVQERTELANSYTEAIVSKMPLGPVNNSQ
jgi:hypothetical protein